MAFASESIQPNRNEADATIAPAETRILCPRDLQPT